MSEELGHQRPFIVAIQLIALVELGNIVNFEIKDYGFKELRNFLMVTV